MTAPFERHRRSDSFPDLGRIVAELGDIRRRSHRTRYGDGPTPELPSRTVIGEIVDGRFKDCFVGREVGQGRFK